MVSQKSSRKYHHNPEIVVRPAQQAHLHAVNGVPAIQRVHFVLAAGDSQRLVNDLLVSQRMYLLVHVTVVDMVE